LVLFHFGFKCGADRSANTSGKGRESYFDTVLRERTIMLGQFKRRDGRPGTMPATDPRTT